MPGRAPGSRKTGGRQKGTPNKQSKSLLARCAELNCDPFEAMLAMVRNPTHDKHFEAAKEVCQYLYPKRKALELSGNISPELLEAAEDVANMTKEQQIELLKAELKQLEGN